MTAIYNNKNGPPILVEFFVELNKISHIKLYESNAKETQWLITGKAPRLEEKICTWMMSYCSGKQPELSLPLITSSSTPFTKAVNEILMDLPFGESLSYKDVAIQLKQPLSFRAVGNACGRNIFPLLIPCHRILTSQGHLGGFSFGTPIKSLLLKHENILFSEN